MKYIIDVPDKWVDITNGLHIPIETGWDMGDFRIDTGLKLIPYTVSDREATENEVWELVRKIVIEMECSERYDCFGDDNEVFVIGTYSYKKVKEKYEAWKKQKNKICIGDEVKVIEVGSPCVVCGIVDGTANLMYGKGDLGQFPVDKLIKTGRHFNELEELLRKVRED